MIPHFITPTEVIVSVSDCGRFIIVGSCPKHDASCVWECYRLRWDASERVFVRSNVRKHLGFKVGARLLAGAFDNYDWFEPHNARRLASLNVEPQLTFARVYSSDLKKFAMLAAKAGGDDALVAVHVGADEVSLASLGPRAISKELAIMPHNSGDGSCVVYAPALKQLASDAGAEVSIAVSFAGVEHREVLRLGGAELWTVNRRAPSPTAAQLPVASYPLADAMRRAFDFASTDAARPSVSQIMIKSLSDGAAMVYGTNGHYLHRERVPLPSPLPRTFTLPVALSKQLPRKSVALAFADDHVRVTLKDGSSARVDAGPAFPPCDSLFNDALGMPIKVAGVELTPKPHDIVVLNGLAMRALKRSLAKAAPIARAREEHKPKKDRAPRVWLVLTKAWRVYVIANKPRNMQRAALLDVDYFEQLLSGAANPTTFRFPHNPLDPVYLSFESTERLLFPRRP